ncbi:hypothetical protein SUGI_0245180 [Cryptomeria japonica]|nr:hypothetical protein SUGI_0245180 [Cryptomeria japonica]
MGAAAAVPVAFIAGSLCLTTPPLAPSPLQAAVVAPVVATFAPGSSFAWCYRDFQPALNSSSGCGLDVVVDGGRASFGVGSPLLNLFLLLICWVMTFSP